jgi:hypothetical protein
MSMNAAQCGSRNTNEAGRSPRRMRQKVQSVTPTFGMWIEAAASRAN